MKTAVSRGWYAFIASAHARALPKVAVVGRRK
eukprot:CAMPEP_0115340530 /NCGR_PEP_ID=MMETSP0270-20121206/91195_1 /TAXON_ID=71861 /ORGANISM="Scrippsiella trochoidea, Strain CCMP3099" /LENGTH=31 /DNA_ID= /DNA_START= /DNA_END= /DNA_ORIENTATION=